MIAGAPEYGDLDRDQLTRIIRHSENSCARAYARILLHELMEKPDVHELEMELRSLREFQHGQQYEEARDSTVSRSSRRFHAGNAHAAPAQQRSPISRRSSTNK